MNIVFIFSKIDRIAIQLTTNLSNCHSADYTQTQTQIESELFRMLVNKCCSKSRHEMHVMAYSHCRNQIWTRTQTRIPNLMGKLYYAEVFTLVWIQIQITTRIESPVVTVPILGTDLHLKDRCPSQFYYISIRGSESESEPMGNFCIVQ